MENRLSSDNGQSKSLGRKQGMDLDKFGREHGVLRNIIKQRFYQNMRCDLNRETKGGNRETNGEW